MSKVIVIKKPGIQKFGHNEYLAMLESGFRTLFDSDKYLIALKQNLSGGPVGMKTNCLARKLNSTPPALCGVLGDLLTKSGIDENNIIVWERTNRELKDAGYELNASSFGRRCLGTDSNALGYGSKFYNSGDVNSLVTSILTTLIKHNINLPVLKDHSLAGLSAGLKNMYGAIHNPNKYHDNNCDPFAAQIFNLQPIKDTNRMTIIDATKAQYNGGPGFDSRYLELYGGLIISTDPVAADTIALEILEHIRQKNKLPTLEQAGRPVKYLKSANKLGLGECDRSKIELIVKNIGHDGSISDGDLI